MGGVHGLGLRGLEFVPRHRFSDRAAVATGSSASWCCFWGLGGLGGHAKIIITFVFLKHTITRASMPKS